MDSCASSKRRTKQPPAASAEPASTAAPAAPTSPRRSLAAPPQHQRKPAGKAPAPRKPRPAVSDGGDSSPRVSLSQAFREEGLDERQIAAGYARTLRRLEGKAPPSAKEKLRLDVLKEVTRVLAPADRAGRPEPYVQVTLLHHVARPVRQPAPAAENEQDGAPAPEPHPP